MGELGGTSVGHYLLRDCLGHSSYTAVYRATTPSGEGCALKLVDMRLQGDENLAQRLRRDAALLDHVHHPNIVPILNLTTADEMTAAAMPYVNGPNLRDLMAGGRVDPELAWNILSQVADALQSAHQWGLICRVLKPSNIVVSYGSAHLAEFGITPRYEGQVGLATPDCELPTAQYLAPEQILGEEPDHRADVYALAVLAFELATAASLSDGAASSAILQRTLSTPPPSAHALNPDISPDVDRVFRRALARDPEGRHASIGALIDELACPPSPDGGGAALRAGPPPRARSVRGAVTIDSLIDVLSDVVTPEDDGTESGTGP
jgi:serine/threonine protein kinase